MKIKNIALMIAIVSLTSLSAIAGTTAPLLSYTSNNGSVAPQYRHTFECNITATEVSTRLVGPMIEFPHTTLKQIGLRPWIGQLRGRLV